METYSEFIKKPEFSPNYLDNHQLPNIKNLDQISVVIPTYNRCPYNPTSSDGYKNPLNWCIESLMNQRGVSLQNIVIINDNSNDHTIKTVKELEKICNKGGIELTYVEHKSNKGSPISKNDGIKNAKGNLVFFADDDCIFTNYSLFGALYNFELLKKREGENKIGAVHIPFYSRTTKPVRPLSISEMGRINLKTGKATSNLKEFPLEYLKNPKYIDEKLKIIEPIRLQNLGGLFLSPKEYLIEIGGYPTYFTWNNGFTEEAEISLKLQERGLKVFHTPDPKFHSVHFKFGAGGNLELNTNKSFIDPKDVNVTSISLEEMIIESSKPRKNTGNRVDANSYLHTKIISFAVLLGKRNPEAAAKWADHTYQTFVINNDQEFSRSIGGVTNLSKEERREIWQSAIEEAKELCKKLKKPNSPQPSNTPRLGGAFAASLF